MMRTYCFPLAAAAMAALSLLGGRPAAAATYNVAASSLPAAITSASNGDTINVFAGTCSSHVTINKSLNIRGAQADVPGYAGTRGGSETILANGVTVAATGVQLNGFVITGGDLVGDTTGSGAFVRVSSSFLTFSNNVVENNIIGLYLNGAGHLVQYNLFRSNNAGTPGNASNGDGIYSDFGLQDAIIDHNSFTGNEAGSVVIIGAQKSEANATVTNLTITNNTILDDGTMAVYGARDVSISGNVVCNIENGHGLILGGGNHHVTVSENQFLASQYRGIRISSGAKYSANSDIRIYNNDIANNRQGGLSVVAGAYTDSSGDLYDRNDDNKVDAECNSWGSVTGPTEAGNPGGTGDKVSGAADYIPFRKYINVTPHAGATLLSTSSNVSTRTYLQVIRITNYGGKAIVGPAYYTLIGFAANGITLANATGTHDDACDTAFGSPWYKFANNGSSLLPGQSVIITLKFTTGVGVTFNTSKIGGTDNNVSRKSFAGNFR